MVSSNPFLELYSKRYILFLIFFILIAIGSTTYASPILRHAHHHKPYTVPDHYNLVKNQQQFSQLNDPLSSTPSLPVSSITTSSLSPQRQNPQQHLSPQTNLFSTLSDQEEDEAGMKWYREHQGGHWSSMYVTLAFIAIVFVLTFVLLFMRDIGCELLGTLCHNCCRFRSHEEEMEEIRQRNAVRAYRSRVGVTESHVLRSLFRGSGLF